MRNCTVTRRGCQGYFYFDQRSLHCSACRRSGDFANADAFEVQLASESAEHVLVTADLWSEACGARRED
jgi:hypothetical protein